MRLILGISIFFSFNAFARNIVCTNDDRPSLLVKQIGDSGFYDVEFPQSGVKVSNQYCRFGRWQPLNPQPVELLFECFPDQKFGTPSTLSSSIVIRMYASGTPFSDLQVIGENGNLLLQVNAAWCSTK